jgi:protein-S-isoprenylcysteine O-methyltransferase Ste14
MGERVWAIFKTVIFTVVVPGSVAGWIPFYLLLPSGARPVLAGAGLAGIVLMALGASLYFWCAWDFSWLGGGTPAPIDPPRALVARGPYRVVRNPMYVGVGAVLVGEAMLFLSEALAIYALVVGFLFHLFVVVIEEPSLRGKFGASYEEYCRVVPRWLPRLKRPGPPHKMPSHGTLRFVETVNCGGGWESIVGLPLCSSGSAGSSSSAPVGQRATYVGPGL